MHKRVLIADTEIDLLKSCKTSDEFAMKHHKQFTSMYAGGEFPFMAKRIGNMWQRREELIKRLDDKRHTIKVNTLAQTAASKGVQRGENLPDEGVILVEILNELRVHTRQLEELLTFARAPKKPKDNPAKDDPAPETKEPEVQHASGFPHHAGEIIKC